MKSERERIKALNHRDAFKITQMASRKNILSVSNIFPKDPSREVPVEVLEEVTDGIEKGEIAFMADSSIGRIVLERML